MIVQTERVKHGLMEDLLTGGLGSEAIMRGVTPKGWQASKLGDVCAIQAGAGFPNKHQGRADEKYPYYKVSDMNNVGNEVFMNNAKNTVSEEVRVELGAKILPAGTVIFPKIGAAIATNKKRIVTRDSLVDNNVIGLQAKRDKVSERFLYYIMLAKNLSDFASTAGVPSIRKSTLAGFTIYLPPLSEQKCIVEILSSVDESICATEAVIAQAECVKRGLMEDLLTGGLGSEAIVRGDVPEGWNSNKLKEICSICGEYGANAPKSDYDPNLPRYVRITDIDDCGNLQEATAVSISHEKAASYILDEGDIVIARSGATVGKSYLHTADNGKCAFAGYLVRFRLRPEIASYNWLKYVLQSKPYWDWVHDNQRVGAQPNINAKEYGSYLLKMPPLVGQQRIARILGSIDDQIVANRSSADQLRRLKRGLMEDILTGRVRTVS